MKNLKYISQQMQMLMTMLSFLFNPVNVLIVNSMQPLKDACTSLKAKVTAVQAKISQYLKMSLALTQAKRKARTDLAATLFPIIASFRSYCLKNGLGDIANSLNFTLNELKLMPFQKLLSLSILATQEIQPLLAKLTAYNINAASIDAINTKYQALYDLMGSRTQAQTKRHNLGVSITSDMADIMNLFHNEISPLVGNFAITQPDFYNDFQKNKRVGIPMTIHTRLNAHVISELGAPYFGLTVQVDAYTDPNTGKNYEASSAVTNANGDAEVSGFFPGLRTVTISGAGVITATFPAIVFAKAKAVQQDFVMQPQFNIPAPAENKQNTNA